MSLYADIIIDISVEKLDKTFQYRIPEALRESVVPGASVMIPFGRGERVIRGYVAGISETPVIEKDRIKDIVSLVKLSDKKGAEEELFSLAVWIKKHYGGTLIQALKVVFPVKKTVRVRKRVMVIPLKSPEELKAAAADFGSKHNIARERTLNALAESGEIDASLLLSKLNINRSVLKALEERGFIKQDSSREYRNPGMAGEKAVDHRTLSFEQQNIFDAFIHDYDMGLRQTCLIRGVTGSGKTDLYIEMIDHVVKSGKQAIVLIPEIALTFQTVMRFSERFGDRVSYMHSRLSQGERYDQFERARQNEIDVMIGPRSALFTPFNNLGIIIIDEEHENSYKSDNMPKYHARETAEMRAVLSDASLILGSATPSVDAYYRAKRGEYRLFTMETRPTGGSLPEVSVVDLRDELMKGNRSMFSLKLQEKIGDRLNKKEQVMLFLNRRGYSGFISCRKCGEVIKCPHCDVSLTSHRDGYLSCHYCGYREKMVETCPSCGSKYIGGMRAGTEQVEEMVKKLFPTAKVLRMDGDTTKHKDDYDNILSRFKDHEADILIGTQMIVKGHDFPLVTLVGIIVADLSLHAGDFRASERTFDLLTQAAGRAGRGRDPGEVVIQTYAPDHYSIEAAAEQDYNKFYLKEIMFRELMSYPPVSHMLKVLIEGKNEDRVSEESERLVKAVRDKAGAGTVSVIGPTADIISKIKDTYRYVFYIKDPDYEQLAEMREMIENNRRDEDRYDTLISYDFDPL